VHTPPKHNLKQCFDLVSETFVSFFLLCLPLSKQLKDLLKKNLASQASQKLFLILYVLLSSSGLWLGTVDAQKIARV